ncbi:MAG TPA: helix-turn-helix transcriptional regulator [Myxococcaceae bacterium]|nr:helix-turn-helix transcriptional regulator [Myxococcaceae bacterium]
MKKKGRVTESGGNVFEDLGLEDASELAIKSDLVAAIYRTITAQGFKNQTEAAVRMGIDQPRVSKLLRGYFDEYSVEKLLEFLAALGNDIEIRVSRQTKAKRGHIRVRAA